MSPDPHLAEWRELLALQVEWGADEAIEDLPLDRLAPLREPASRPPPPPTPSRAPQAAPLRTAGSPSSAAARAEAAARAATSLDALRDALAAFDGSTLAPTAGSLVFGQGDPAARLVVIAEAPGAEDDANGRPLSGEIGAFFDRMLRSVGLARDDVRIVCLVPWRPPGDRPPTPAEIAVVKPFLEAQLRLVGAAHHLLLGGTVARALTGATGTMRRLRGTWQGLRIQGLPPGASGLVVTPPAQAFREPALRRDVWRDWLALRKTLDAGSVTTS